MGKPHLTSTKFSDLDLHDSLKESLEDNQYEYCTAIQEKTLPKLLAGKDITGQAQTGTGKTATFLLATLNHLMTVPVAKNKKGPFALIMAPTRELAVQIHEDAEMLGAYTGLKFALLYGGAGYGKQKAELEANADVVIGTVGRILDFYKQRELNLRDIEVLVLDEADRMFDLGFINDVRYLVRQMPSAEKRRNMLFSATFSQRVLELAYEYMNDPETIKIEPEQVTGDRIEQVLYHVSKDEKRQLLFGLLKRENPDRAIIFVNTKREADDLYAYLGANDYKAAVLSGDIPQRRRESLLEDFKEGKLSIMVATDVAARGLHIEGVTHVFNYDLPQDVEDYVHRIGRTARAGATGRAISLACEEYVYSLPDIEEYIKAPIPVETIDDGLLVELVEPSREERRRSNNRRNNQRNDRNDRNDRGNRNNRSRRPRRDNAQQESGQDNRGKDQGQNEGQSQPAQNDQRQQDQRQQGQSRNDEPRNDHNQGNQGNEGEGGSENQNRRRPNNRRRNNNQNRRRPNNRRRGPRKSNADNAGGGEKSDS